MGGNAYIPILHFWFRLLKWAAVAPLLPVLKEWILVAKLFVRVAIFVKTKISKGKTVGVIVIPEMVLVLVVEANGLLHA